MALWRRDTATKKANGGAEERTAWCSSYVFSNMWCGADRPITMVNTKKQTHLLREGACMQRVHTSSPRQLPPTGRARIHFCDTYAHTTHTLQKHTFVGASGGSNDALSGFARVRWLAGHSLQVELLRINDEQARTYHAAEREDAGFDIWYRCRESMLRRRTQRLVGGQPV